jgi:hypothetical protein
VHQQLTGKMPVAWQASWIMQQEFVFIRAAIEILTAFEDFVSVAGAYRKTGAMSWHKNLSLLITEV